MSTAPRFLFIGLGGIGQRHLRNLRSLLGEAAEVLAYRSRGHSYVLTDKLQIGAEAGLHETYGVRVFNDLDAALAEKPDAAFICNPSSMHLPVALAAAKAGCHLFLEKPVSHDLEGIDELQAIVDEKKLITLVGYQLRYHPCLTTPHGWLQENRIGRILAVRADVGEHLPSWHPYEDYRIMYASRRDLGGGVVLSQIHEIDYLLWFFGAPKRLFSVGGHLSSLEIDVEDVASTLMEVPCGGRTIPISLHQDYLQKPPSRTCQIIGDNGKILIDFHGLSARLFAADGTLLETRDFQGFDRNELFLGQMRHFLACLRGEAQPLNDLRSGALSLRIALAIKESLETGTPYTF